MIRNLVKLEAVIIEREQQHILAGCQSDPGNIPHFTIDE